MDDLRRSVARLSTPPGHNGPWESVALILSADPDLWPLGAAVTDIYPDLPDDDTDLIMGLVRPDEPCALEVSLWNFTWQGPEAVSSNDRWSLELWIPVTDDSAGALVGGENWSVLWIPAVRQKFDLTTTIPAGEIAFTTEGNERVAAKAPPVPAVPPERRGEPITYLYTQHTTTERPPAERNALGQ